MKDPKWAADIGAPTFVTAFGYRDRTVPAGDRARLRVRAAPATGSSY
jgi:hypothetical protein